jgi:hypothetical protein
MKRLLILVLLLLVSCDSISERDIRRGTPKFQQTIYRNYFFFCYFPKYDFYEKDICPAGTNLLKVKRDIFSYKLLPELLTLKLWCLEETFFICGELE